MRRRALLVAGEIDLRARIARALQSSGYAVELASDEKRALRLTTDDNFELAIVVSGSSPAKLAMLAELRDNVPKIIVVAQRPEEIARSHGSLPGTEVILLQKSNEDAVIRGVGEIIAAANRTADIAELVRVSYALKSVSWTWRATFSSLLTVGRLLSLAPSWAC